MRTRKGADGNMGADMKTIRFVTIVMLVFSLLTVLSVSVLMNEQFNNMALVLSTAVSQRGGESPIAVESVPVVKPVKLDATNKELAFSRIIHPFESETCYQTVKGYLSTIPGINIESVSEDDAAYDSEYGHDPFIFIQINPSFSFSAAEEMLTKVKRNVGHCLQGIGNGKTLIQSTSGTSNPSGPNEVVQAAGMKPSLALFDDGDEDEDWNEPDEVGNYALAESLPLVNVPSVQATGYDGKDIDVCIIDSGMDIHPNLPVPSLAFNSKTKKEYFASNIAAGIDDELGHGTAIAGVIGSNSTIYHGVSPGARLMIVKLSKDAPSKKEVIRAIKVCAGSNKNKIKADVIYIGVQFVEKKKNKPDYTLYEDTETPIKGSGNIKSIYTTIEKYSRLDPKKKVSSSNPYVIPVVVPAGNTFPSMQDDTGVTKLAAINGTIAVGAVYDADLGSKSYTYLLTGTPCTDATTGPNKVMCLSACGNLVDFVAPGASVKSTGANPPVIAGIPVFNENVYGTSVSAAHVTGIIALMKQVVPSATNQDIINALDVSATIPSGGDASCYGNGVVNAAGAIASLLGV